jgi:hypothetical protein
MLQEKLLQWVSALLMDMFQTAQNPADLATKIIPRGQKRHYSGSLGKHQLVWGSVRRVFEVSRPLFVANTVGGQGFIVL